MLEMDKRTNLLEENEYQYSMQDVDEPKLYRELYDYESIPRVSFNHRLVPMRMPKEIWVTDTTFRDGQQACRPFTVQQIVDLFKIMSRLSGPNGVLRQSEFFLYTEKDREAVRQCQDLGLKFPEITTWIRANDGDFELVKQAGVDETGILVSCSDYHIFKKMNMTRAQAMDKYLGVVKNALDFGIRPRCHFEDATRADFYGFVVPFASELMKLSGESGIPIKVRVCDTMGYGVSYPGASLPRSVPGIIYGLRHYANVPSELLEWHGHNDFYKVVTNAATAWLYGCSAVNTSALGIGERTGNCPLEAMLIEYASLMGDSNGIDLSAITDMAEYFEHEVGIAIPPRTPFVGSMFNTTKAGIHADGLLKDEEIYNIFNTEKLLKRPPRALIDSHSGLAGIAHWINRYYNLAEDKLMNKRSELVQAVKAKVDKMYEQGRNHVMTDDELHAMVQEEKPGFPE